MSIIRAVPKATSKQYGNLIQSMTEAELISYQQVLDYWNQENPKKIQSIMKFHIPAFHEGQVDPSSWVQRTIELVELGNAFTHKKAVLLYGDVLGQIKWDQYRARQATSNTYEYKKARHGMTREEYDAYNKSRAQTQLNMIKRYGEVEGVARWIRYCDIQREAGVSLNWFIEQYGEVEGTQRYETVCKAKVCTLERYITKHGEELGRQLYTQRVTKTEFKPSKLSLELFSQLDVPESIKVYCGHVSNEFGIHGGDRYYLYDFCIPKAKLIIEFHGDYWHGNPRIYQPNDIIGKGKRRTAAEQWAIDEAKQQAAICAGFKLFVVWESDYLYNKQATVETCNGIIKRALDEFELR